MPDYKSFTENQNRMNPLKKGLIIIAGVVALIYSLSFYFWTNLDDPYYWYNSSVIYWDDFMVAFSMWIGNIWRHISGNNILYYRLLAWILSLASLSVPYFLLQERKSYKSNIWYLILGVIFMGEFTQAMYTPDSLTIFFFVLIACLVLKSGVSEIKNIIVIAILSGLASAARFPNILCIPFIALYIIVVLWKDKRRGALNFLLYTVLSVAIYYVLVCTLIGSFHLIAASQQSISMNLSSGNGSHSIQGLLILYGIDFLNNFIGLSSLLGVFFVCYYFIQKFKNYFLILPALALLYIPVHHFDFDGRIFSFLCILLILYYGVDNKDKMNIWTILFIALLGIISCAGSNTGFLKIRPYYAAFSPLILIAFKEQIKKNLYLNCVVLFLAFLFFIKPLQKSIIQYHDDISLNYEVSLLDYNHFSDFPNYPALFVKEVNDRLHNQMADYKEYGVKDHTLFYGRPAAHEMYAITNSRIYYPVPFYMEPKKENLNIGLFKYLFHDSKMVLFDYTKSPRIQEELQKRNYKLVKSSGNVNIYRKNER